MSKVQKVIHNEFLRSSRVGSRRIVSFNLTLSRIGGRFQVEFYDGGGCHIARHFVNPASYRSLPESSGSFAQIREIARAHLGDLL